MLEAMPDIIRCANLKSMLTKILHTAYLLPYTIIISFPLAGQYAVTTDDELELVAFMTEPINCPQ